MSRQFLNKYTILAYLNNATAIGVPAKKVQKNCIKPTGTKTVYKRLHSTSQNPLVTIPSVVLDVRAQLQL